MIGIDTSFLIAATWHVAGIQNIYTLNPKDFTVFQQFIAHPRNPEPPPCPSKQSG